MILYPSLTFSKLGQPVHMNDGFELSYTGVIIVNFTTFLLSHVKFNNGSLPSLFVSDVKRAVELLDKLQKSELILFNTLRSKQIPSFHLLVDTI